MDSVALLQNDILLNSHPGGRQTYGTPVLVLQKPVILEVDRPTADSTWLLVTLVRVVPEWGGSSVA
ncbi:hypothetical protein [uncultured Fibrobacter sp.]|uniref:hypothetical protein n=1 Tax=uncultured Fibrobacter sp. TaxID=261512 RepID=UPI0025F2D503|nr:hypothetical protein [uncultured Fibrobacter sp.]